MSTDLEADLRREFDAADMPAGLTFHAESVLQQGNRTIRRRRIIAAGSAAAAVAVIATGASLLTRPDDSALPLPASSTAATGIVRSTQWGTAYGVYDVEFNRDTRVKSNVRYFFTPKDGQRREVGSSSTGKPGQKPDAVWWSAMVDGHPITLGLVPSLARAVKITFVGISYSLGIEELKGTGFSMFYVGYTPAPPNDTSTEPRRPSEIASIRWTGPNGIVDGIEGDHRLTGRTLTMGRGLAVEVVLRPGDDGRITVFGRTLVYSDDLPDQGPATDLSLATTDLSGAAVVTGRQPTTPYPPTPTNADLQPGEVFIPPGGGVPIAAGILPPGAKEIGVVLVSNDAATGLAVHERLPDGRVIFALKADWGQSSDPRKASIRAITWTNADGTPGRIDVTQKNFTALEMQG